MKHLGDISKINGAEIEPVDIISFGSPCQDLSVAGKRAGLKHEDNGDDETTRSGLFMEAVRIIREMREKTNGEYPRYAVWENVPGAFSSNKGEDFRIVLEELIKIVEPTAVMPTVPKNGWAYADSFTGDGWSLAYRVFDAQYWGVPQRRRRIYLVADFRGERAREVLFEREGLRGYFTQSRTQRETATGDSEGSVGTADCANECVAYGISSYNSNARMSDNPHSGIYEAETSRTLDLNGGNPSCNQGGIAVLEPVCYNGENITSPLNKTNLQPGDPCHTLGTDSRNYVAVTQDQYLFQPVTYDSRGNGDGAICNTITGDHENRITDYTSVVVEPTYIIDGDKIGKAEREGGSGLGIREGDKMYTLTAKDKHGVAYGINGDVAGTLDANYYKGCGLRQGVEREVVAVPVAYLASGKNVVGTLMANASTKLWLGNQEALSGDYHIIEECYYRGGFGEYLTYANAGTVRASGGDCGGGSENLVVTPRYIVRRLTPTECARLQGFPDCWGHPDTFLQFSDEEYRFWLDVRNTHAEINGKQTKEYTKAQMLTWYNKLHTDSSEYKMWGNGIALPNALYVMQGIADI